MMITSVNEIQKIEHVSSLNINSTTQSITNSTEKTTGFHSNKNKKKMQEKKQDGEDT